MKFVFKMMNILYFKWCIVADVIYDGALCTFGVTPEWENKNVESHEFRIKCDELPVENDEFFI